MYLLNRLEPPAAIFPYQLIDFNRLNAGKVRAGVVLVIVLGTLVVAHRLAVILAVSAAHAVAARLAEDMAFKEKIFRLHVQLALIYPVVLQFVLSQLIQLVRNDSRYAAWYLLDVIIRLPAFHATFG